MITQADEAHPGKQVVEASTLWKSIHSSWKEAGPAHGAACLSVVSWANEHHSLTRYTPGAWRDKAGSVPE